MSKISGSQSKEAFIQIVKNEEEVLIKSNMTEMLKENQTFEKEEFWQQVNKFECIFIEVKYPSSAFDAIYNNLVSLKKSKIPKLKIAILITGITETDQHFKYNKDLSYVTLDKCVTKIQSDGINGSLKNCSSLEYISIPSSVTQIGDWAFSSCSSLTQITIPSSVTQIEDCAFFSCPSLTQITIQQDHESRFKFFENELLIHKSSNDGDYDTIVWAKKNIKTINIPSSVTQIGNCAFYSCSSLTQIAFFLFN